MKRRIFLTSLLATAGTILGPSDIVKIDLTKGAKPVKVKAGEVKIVESGTCLQLPKNAKNGDVVQLIVENRTLEQPSYIQSHHAKVAGDDEPLILDSMANIRLVFRAETKDWELA